MSKDSDRSYLLKHYLQQGKTADDPNVHPWGTHNVEHLPAMEWYEDSGL